MPCFLHSNNLSRALDFISYRMPSFHQNHQNIFSLWRFLSLHIGKKGLNVIGLLWMQSHYSWRTLHNIWTFLNASVVKILLLHFSQQFLLPQGCSPRFQWGSENLKGRSEKKIYSKLESSNTLFEFYIPLLLLHG